jgi:signal transduction histidine kinase
MRWPSHETGRWKSSRVKSEFLARVSHELRTPLGVIRGYADLLSEPVYGTLSELQTKAVSEIIDSTERISDMVGELLDEARLAAGAVQLEIKPFNPLRYWKMSKKSCPSWQTRRNWL